MDAMTYIKDVGIPQAREIAQNAGTTYEYLYQIACGHRNAGTELALKLADESGGKLDAISLMTSKQSAA